MSVCAVVISAHLVPLLCLRVCARLHTDMELVLKHRMLNRVREQLKHFLTGFYEIIPEALLTIFDFQVCITSSIKILLCACAFMCSQQS